MKGASSVPNVITIDNGDGTSFIGVTDGTISQDGPGPGATILYTGVGWAMVAGKSPRVRNSFAGIGAQGSKILLQNFGGQPATCRIVLLESSGGGNVTLLANG